MSFVANKLSNFWKQQKRKRRFPPEQLSRLRRIEYPYLDRDLWEESREIRPKNRIGWLPLGIFLVEEQKFHEDEFLTAFFDKLIIPHENFHDQERIIGIWKEHLRTGNDWFFIHIDEPKFIGGRPNLRTCQFTEKDMPHFNFPHEKYRTLGFCTGKLVQDRTFIPWFKDYLKSAFQFLEAPFGWCGLYDDMVKYKRKDPRDHVHGLTFYGKELTERIVREKLQSAPVYSVKELENGGVIMMLADQPFFPPPREYRKRVSDHLGLKPKRSMKPKVPEWMQSTTVGRVSRPKKDSISLIAGAKAESVMIRNVSESETNLFDYFVEFVHEAKNLKSNEKEAFVAWFNKLECGLETFLSGSAAGGAGGYGVHIGLPVISPINNFGFEIQELDHEAMIQKRDEADQLFDQLELESTIGFHILTWGKSL